MNTGLLAASVNIIIISALAAVYGLYESAPQILGLGLSGVILGAVLAGVSASTPRGPRGFLEEAVRLDHNALTGIQETLDLLDARIYAVRGPEPRIVITKSQQPLQAPDPGVGVDGGSPYISIPLTGVLEDVAQLEELDEVRLRNALYDYLAGEFSLCRALDVEVRGPTIRVVLTGLDETAKALAGYPASPLTLLLTALLYRLTGSSLRLAEHGRAAEGLYWVYALLGG